MPNGPPGAHIWFIDPSPSGPSVNHLKRGEPVPHIYYPALCDSPYPAVLFTVKYLPESGNQENYYEAALKRKFKVGIEGPLVIGGLPRVDYNQKGEETS